MRLITSPILSTEDTDAIIGAENQDGSAFLRLEAALLENVEILKQEMEADIINAFSWMLYDGIIDMRFAIPCEKLEEGDFHDKFGDNYFQRRISGCIQCSHAVLRKERYDLLRRNIWIGRFHLKNRST